MCGRYDLHTPRDIARLELDLNLALLDDLSPRYNIAPRTPIAIIRSNPAEEDDGDQLTLTTAVWGFRPAWAAQDGPQPINARAETVATSPFYRSAFRSRRCLMPANGWYEWRKEAGRKQPYYFSTTGLLLLAGIWSAAASGDLTCAILTEPARGVARDIHSRMPVSVDSGSWRRWLDPQLQDREEIRAAVEHIPDEQLRCWPVSTRVNSVQNDDGSLIEPEPEPPHA